MGVKSVTGTSPGLGYLAVPAVSFGWCCVRNPRLLARLVLVTLACRMFFQERLMLAVQAAVSTGL